MNNTKFKSGDKVVFCKSSLESGMIDAKEGDVFTVQCVEGSLVYLIELPGGYHKTHFEHYVKKEKVMEKYIPKVGDKVKGFVFNENEYPSIGYPESMDDFVGKHGTVYRVIEDRFYIDFRDYRWSYPLELAHLAKIEEPSKFEDSPKEIPQQDSQIDWQVGQEVWDVLRGKGVVFAISTNSQNPVGIKFDSGSTTHAYRDGSLLGQNHIRTLFFSEPKIIAETKPPKKAFVPILKEGVDVFIKIKDGWFGEGTVRTVYKEAEDRIYTSDDGWYFLKRDIESIRVLSEQVKFS